MKKTAIIMIIALAFFGCDKDPPPDDDPICDCDPKEHYLACTCPVAGTDACSCQIIPRGELTEYQATTTFPIYQKEGVTDEQAITVTNALTNAWNDSDIVSNSDKSKLKGKIQEIWIIETAVNQVGKFDVEAVNNKMIVKVQYNCPYIDEIFMDLAENRDIYLTQVN